jgi:hypothetical protein
MKGYRWYERKSALGNERTRYRQGTKGTNKRCGNGTSLTVPCVLNNTAGSDSADA